MYSIRIAQVDYLAIEKAKFNTYSSYQLGTGGHLYRWQTLPQLWHLALVAFITYLVSAKQHTLVVLQCCLLASRNLSSYTRYLIIRLSKLQKTPFKNSVESDKKDNAVVKNITQSVYKVNLAIGVESVKHNKE